MSIENEGKWAVCLGVFGGRVVGIIHRVMKDDLNGGIIYWIKDNGGKDELFYEQHCSVYDSEVDAVAYFNSLPPSKPTGIIFGGA
jgi:hypothetical protein